MSTGFDPAYKAALLGELRKRVRQEQRPVWRRPLPIAVAAVAAVALAGAATAAAAGVIGLPGAPQAVPLGKAIVQEHQGAATVDLGTAPKGATDIAVDLWCLSAGAFKLADGSVVKCTASDIGSQSSVTLPLAAGQHTTSIDAPAAAQWRISVAYVNQTTTPWAVNAHGQSYGIENSQGTPELVAVQTADGKDGYAFAKALQDADGTTAAKSFKSPADALKWQQEMSGKRSVVPVYLSDGTTWIGTFVIEHPVVQGG